MKKIICALLLLVICFTAVSCGKGSKVEVPDGMKEAYSEEDIFYLFIPSSWTYERGFGMPYAYFSASDTSNVSVMLYIPDDYTETTTTSAENTTSAEITTLAEETTLTPEVQNPKAPFINAYWDNFTSEANATLQSFDLESFKETTLDNYFAHDYVYTHQTGGVDYKHRAVITYYAGMIVCFTYSSTAENYDKHIADVDDMLAHFTFKK